MAPRAPAANGGAGNGGVSADGAAPSSGNDGAGHHWGSSENNGGVARGTTTALPSVAANGNGNGKRHGRRKRRPAVNPKDKYWTPIDEKEAAAAVEDGGEDGRRPLLFRTYRVKGILLHPYRCVYYHRIRRPT
jgi:1,4-beta-D-xylan synthase